MLRTMNDLGHALSESELIDLEWHIGRSLPQDYREFLLKYNGGAPEECTIDIPSLVSNKGSVDIGYFYGIGTGAEDIQVCMGIIYGYIPQGLIPIADTPGGNYFFLSLIEGSENLILFRDHEVVDGECFNTQFNLLSNYHIVANSFIEFVDKLY